MDYKKAGVDIEAGYKAVSLMKEHIASTMRPEVLTDIGGFSAIDTLALVENSAAHGISFNVVVVSVYHGVHFLELFW